MTDFHKQDLNLFLNHKYVNFEVGETAPETYRVAHFDELFKPECLPGINETYERYGIPFIFPDISKEGYDHVCCEGQSLETAVKRYSKMHLIGFCESADFSETICVIDANGLEEQVEVFFYNFWKGIESWEYDRPSKICKVAGLVTTTSEGPRAIFCCSVPFPNGMEVCHMKLPFNPNMHVFSITLETP
ncbi:hypothetical protein Back11_19400 [Paenibacillus baekrokdamisoli]|uniref:Uncharacterized protein n=1 Tax=Paenibacillus baekrokdamisoli TaxID=1712516 RepID=A0A3G9IWR9_9BACL|nr:hypothetical protein [Paenibacillus baekrokdamisoli]MBB3070057.1 hypothetical protein [Paenibacillus baekrokdamisoli]BBH20595.1 hypothetical protein Back11_19400 [Paenibacillus baekrokdamisoli]